MYNLKEGAVLVLDTEGNALRNPTKLHLVCTRTPEGETREFIKPLEDPNVTRQLFEYLSKFETFIGQNIIQYDLQEVFDKLLLGHPIRSLDNVLDTLVFSRLFYYGIPGGHSVKAWGERFGIAKEGQDIEQWDELTPEMIERCHSDTLITLKIFEKYKKYIANSDWYPALRLEHEIAKVCGQMTEDGFAFDKEEAERLYLTIKELRDPIDAALQDAFPPKVVPVREVTPRVTQSGAFNLNDFRWYDGDDLSIFFGGPFTLVEYIPFNPGSPKQIVDRLNAAGWKPTDKTKGHQDAIKTWGRKKLPEEKIAYFKEFGWKVNEENLKTLPTTAPKAAFDLAKRIVLQSRLSDLEEWLALVEPEGDIHAVHGSFNPIGAWTHRLSHSRPNLANVPVAKRSGKDNEFETLINDLNDDMRGLWKARPGHRLIGTDADGLQMRIFAHYVNDEELINALIKGSKENKTDIHSVHQRKLGQPCKSRDAAKTFIYAWLLGAGLAKVSEILECTTTLARGSIDGFIDSYPLLAELKRTQIPRDATRGFFIGLDGRKVICNSEHLMLAGYLQNGEAIIMKGACLQWQKELRREKIPFRMVTWPHDEWQTEIPDDDDIAKFVSDVQIQSLRDQAGRLAMNCPLEGTTTIQKDHPPYPDGFIGGYTWKDTH